MSQKRSGDEFGSHRLLESGSETPIQTPTRDTSIHPTENITSILSAVERLTPDSAPAVTPPTTREKGYEHDLHADLHWTINPCNPRNWTKRKKWMHTVLFCTISWTIMLGASNLTLAHNELMDGFHVSSVTAVLPTSFYLFGLVLSPLCQRGTELFGRKTAYLVCVPVYAIFILAAGLVENIYGLVICRLIASFAASPALQLGYASILNIWTAEELIAPLTCYICSLLVGTPLGPVLSGAIVWRRHWKWTQFAVLIIVSLLCIPMLATNETSKTVILRKSRPKVSKLSLLRDGFEKQDRKPMRLVFSEPTALLYSVLNAYNFGVLYAILTAFPAILLKEHQFDAGAQGLGFLGMSIGVVLALGMQLCHQRRCYIPRVFRYKEEKVSEDERTLYTGKRMSKYSSRTSFSASTEHISIGRSVGRSSRRNTLLQSLKRLSIPTSKGFEPPNPEWRRNMKISYAATGYLNGIDENCGRRIKPERVSNLLDQKLDFSQLCTALEGHKLKFDRVTLATVLVEALADETETPATYPQTSNEDVEQHRKAAASALEAPKDATPKTSTNEKRKTWMPPSTSPPPEWRLWLAIPASPLIVASLFMLGWTARIHWIATVISMALFAFAYSLIFMSTTFYILECFDAAQRESLLAGSSVLNFAFGFVFSLFATSELKLGPGIGMSVYATVSIFSGLVPSGLYIYGPALRKRREISQRK